MNLQKGTRILAVMLVGAVIALGSPAAVRAVGTTGGTQIENAIAPAAGDTFPSADGEMSVRWTNESGGDTNWADSDPGNATNEVDTGYDMNELATQAPPSDSFTYELHTNKSGATLSGDGVNGDGNEDSYTVQLTSGDTAVYAFNLHNLSNNDAPIPYTIEHFINGTTASSDDTFVLELFVAAGDSDATQFDSGAGDITRITNSDTPALMFTENEVKTLFAVQTVKGRASRSDSVVAKFFATDNAPVDGDGADPNNSGDQWERHRSISGEDTWDTQVAWITTTIAGPKLKIDKSLESLQAHDGFRPGDTVLYTIQVWNTGLDTAANVEVMDAMPTNTTYVANSNSDTSNGNTLLSTEFDTQTTGTFSGNAGTGGDSATERIKWTWETIGPDGNTSDSVAAEFKVTID